MSKIKKIGQIDCSGDKPLTQQHLADECDANKIVERFMRSGDPALLDKKSGQFLDTTSFPSSYQDALNYVVAARNSFDALDPNLRLRFNNDPHQLIEFLNNPSNREEALKLGLLNAPNGPDSANATPSTSGDSLK